MGYAVETAHGHIFVSTGDEKEDDCLCCGARYQLVPGYREGIEKYVAANGDDALQCTGRTDLSHGYERVCQNDNGRECEAMRETGTCEHTSHDCNCLQCQ